MASHGAAFSDRQAQDPLHKARDHAALFQLHLHAVAAAIGNGFVAIRKAAAKADAGHIATGGWPIFHRQQGRQLPAGLFQQLVHPGGIEDHGLGLRLEAPGRLEAGGGLHIQGHGDHQLFPRGEARQQGLKTLLKLRAPQRRNRFLLQCFLHHTLDQLFEGGGAQPHRTDLLQQHRLGHLALAKARQFDATAEFADGILVAGLATARRHRHLYRQSTAGAGGGGDFQLGPWGGGSGAGGRTHETGRSSGRLPILESGVGGGWRPSVGTTHRRVDIPTRPRGAAGFPRFRFSDPWILIAALQPIPETAYSSRGRRFQGWQEPSNLSLSPFFSQRLSPVHHHRRFGALKPLFGWFLLFSLF